MMTSVTLPSSSGTLNGGYSSPVTEGISNSKADSDSPRTSKRSLSITSSDSCKKRRKQSTPIRISTTESESSSSNSQEGKPSPEEPTFRCPICQAPFPQHELLQNHLVCDHPVECKKEPEEQQQQQQQHLAPNSSSYLEHNDASMGLSMLRTDMPWISEMQGKEWMGSSLASLPFNPVNAMFMALPQFSQPENMPTKPIRIFNPDAYCDLCNKEFCNKYFLKTHKANKHGIYMDNSSSESFQTAVTVPSLTTNIKISNAVPSVESCTIKNEPITPVTNPFHTIFSNTFSNQANLSESELNDNVAMSNGQSSSSDSEKIFPDDQPARGNRSPSITQTESTSVKNDPDTMFQDTSSKLSSDQASRELDSYRLKKVGVMNPKAFCEICCKEYCNKYFLRTHKLKRHGIYIPDDREKSDSCTINFSSSSNIQTSPLNLIMTEQTSSDSKTTSPSNITCDICCIKFQNASLAHIHNVTVHGKVFTKETEETDKQEPKKLPEIFKTTDKCLNAEAISEDLQKLQTMILQLNELDPSKVALACTMCNKEFENRFYLHAHMMSEHGILIDEAGEVEKNSDTENVSNNNTMCDICGKEVQNADEMSKHILKFHSNNHQLLNDPPRDDYNGYPSGEKLPNRISVSSGLMPERRISMNVTPTSSYCEICNKELCNKYFMKTHMQRMHGIEIENGAQIGGVVCDICNKELCSKYFLRVHKHNTHGIIEYGSNLLPPRKSEGESATPTPSSAPPPEADPALKPGDLADLSHRYFTHFTEVCTICSRRFRSTKWLKAHLVTDHGQVGIEKWTEIEQQLQQSRVAKPATSINVEGTSSPNLKIPSGGQDHQHHKTGIQNFISSLFGIDESNSKMYQCSFCPFTSPLLPLLFVHERSHSLNMEGIQMKCPVCSQHFVERELLQRHILAQHPFLLPSMIKEEDVGQKEVKDDGTEEAERYSDTIKPDQTTKQRDSMKQQQQQQQQAGSPIKLKPVELSSEMGQSLSDAAKKMQWPATYAIPQSRSHGGSDQDAEDVGFSSRPGYVMQAFLLEESTSERRVLPSVVFLPMLQKQPAPISVTFTLTPA